MTFGHLDVVSRGRRIFDRIVIGVGHNPDKETLFSAEERIQMVRELTADLVAKEPGSAPVDVLGYSGLTVDFAREVGRRCCCGGFTTSRTCNTRYSRR